MGPILPLRPATRDAGVCAGQDVRLQRRPAGASRPAAHGVGVSAAQDVRRGGAARSSRRGPSVHGTGDRTVAGGPDGLHCCSWENARRPLPLAHARARWRPSSPWWRVGGVRSLGELDVGRAMRRRGLPEPARQVLRRRPSGTQYLDADFPEQGITLEVDGAQHDLPDARLADLLRDLDLAAGRRTVVRLPLVAWRLDEGAVLDGLEALFLSRGWRRPAA